MGHTKGAKVVGSKTRGKKAKGAKTQQVLGNGDGDGDPGDPPTFCVRGANLLLPPTGSKSMQQFGPEGLGNQNDADADDTDDNGLEPCEAELAEEDLRIAQAQSQDSSPEQPRLNNQTTLLLSALASTARDTVAETSDLSKIVTGVHHCLRKLITGSSSSLAIPTTPPPLAVSSIDPFLSSLADAAQHCQDSELLDAMMQLTYWVNVMVFASQVNQ